mmetsp:Transcript_25042/g.73793  ORF Transcript_25042/g.73793 Transcript_25042/m.73793 type:complete len:224 (-) Transcript_25042:292-963(-)
MVVGPGTRTSESQSRNRSRQRATSRSRRQPAREVRLKRREGCEELPPVASELELVQRLGERAPPLHELPRADGASSSDCAARRSHASSRTGWPPPISRGPTQAPRSENRSPVRGVPAPQRAAEPVLGPVAPRLEQHRPPPPPRPRRPPAAARRPRRAAPSCSRRLQSSRLPWRRGMRSSRRYARSCHDYSARWRRGTEAVGRAAGARSASAAGRRRRPRRPRE